MTIWKPKDPVQVNNQEIWTGIDFKKASKLNIVFIDDNQLIRSWPVRTVDLDTVRDNTEAIQNCYIDTFDNDFLRMYIVDWTRGIIRFSDHGRPMKVYKIVPIFKGAS